MQGSGQTHASMPDAGSQYDLNPCAEKGRVMKVLGVVLLAGSLMVIGGGCGGSSSAPAGAVSGPAAGEPVGMGQGDNRAGVRLEREGFALLGFHARVDEYDRVYVVGEIQNVGTAARGVELQATLRDV